MQALSCCLPAQPLTRLRAAPDQPIGDAAYQPIDIAGAGQREADRTALRERLQARGSVLPAKTGGSALLGQRSLRAGCDQITRITPIRARLG